MAIPDERIFLLASSYGTRVAAHALADAPQAYGGIVLLSSVRFPMLREHALEKVTLKLAFHGEKDDVSDPETTLAELKRVFGKDVEWCCFEDEGHSFQRTRTWATVYSLILERMGRSR